MFESNTFPNPIRRISGRVVACAVAALVAILIVTVAGTDSAALSEPTAPGAPVETSVEAAVETPAFVAPPPNTLPPEPVEDDPSTDGARPLIVPDPRPGDLRFDASGDVLPTTYVPQIARTIPDLAYGPLDAHRLDLHLPDADEAPLIVYVHGGGWVGGDRAHVPDFVLRFVERGYAVASIGYHLAPEHPFPAAVHDTKLAIRWLKAYGAVDPAVDADRIVLIGASAGGHLAAFAAATVGQFEPQVGPELRGFDSSVAGVVAAVGPTDLTTFYDHDHPWAAPLTEAFLGCSPCTTTTLADASPSTHVHAELPPAYFAVGADDELINLDTQGVSGAAEWANAVGSEAAWLDVVEGRGHNIDDGTINQRFLEAFVDQAASTSVLSADEHSRSDDR